jgi:rubrerythrin
MRQMLRQSAKAEATKKKHYLQFAPDAEKEKLLGLRQRLGQLAAAEHRSHYKMECLLW